MASFRLLLPTLVCFSHLYLVESEKKAKLEMKAVLKKRATLGILAFCDRF